MIISQKKKYYLLFFLTFQAVHLQIFFIWYYQLSLSSDWQDPMLCFSEKKIFDEIPSLAQNLHGLVWSSFLATRYFPLLYPGPVVHPQEFGSHSFCPRALFLPAPCQYFSINASEQMSIFLLLNLYLLLASISGNIQERGTYLWWYELHIEHNGFHDYHAHPSDTIYVHSRISEGVQSSELRFWQNRTQSWLHVYCSTWLHYISQLLGWWNIV